MQRQFEPEEIHAIMSRLGMAWIRIDRQIEAAEEMGIEVSSEDRAFRNSYHIALAKHSETCHRLGWSQLVSRLAAAVRKLGRNPVWKDGTRPS